MQAHVHLVKCTCDCKKETLPVMTWVLCTLCKIQAVMQLCGSNHLKSLEDVQSQCEVSRSYAGVDQSGVGVYVWCDATPAHVSYQGQCLAQLLSLPTQADHCMSFRPLFRIVCAAGTE